MTPLQSFRSLAAGLACGAFALLGATAQAAGGSWTLLKNQPSFAACEAFLLTDGRVLVNAYDSDPSCWLLTPDKTGSYINGTWSKAASMHSWRLFYGSSVLADGRVIVVGGEYSSKGDWGNGCEIYNPDTNVWTTINPPSGWSQIGDCCSMILPNGKFMIGSDFDNRTAVYDPVAGTWSAGPNNIGSTSDESCWALMPNNVVEMVDAFDHPSTQAYVYPNNVWVNTGSTPTNLVDPSSLELGPSMLLPNQQLFQMGAIAASAIYTMPSSPTGAGTWTQGPNPPTVGGRSLVAADAPCAWMPNGKVLLSLGPLVSGGFASSTDMAEYDPASNTMYTVSNFSNSSQVSPYNTRLLLLPNGQVFETASVNKCSIYTPDGSPNAAFAPTIASAPSQVSPGSTYPISGTQFNGVTQGSSYGDDSWNATNYPLVRIVNNATGDVAYCKTHDHSTMGVATGSASVSTNFDVPATIETGPSTIYVVADGSASVGQSILVGSAQIVDPNAYAIIHGTYKSGTLNSLFNNDGDDLVVQQLPTVTITQPKVDVQATGISPVQSPTSLQVAVAAFVNTSHVTQKISMFNYSTNAWDVVDTRAAATSDTVVTVSPGGTLANYVNPSTKEMQIDVSYSLFGATPIVNWMASIDEINWYVQ